MEAKRAIARRCYIAASLGTDLTVLGSALSSAQYEIVSPTVLDAASRWSEVLRASLSDVDLVIGVLREGGTEGNVLFELGFAAALGCRIALFAPSLSSVPSDLADALILHTSLDDATAVRFAIEQLSAAPPKRPKHRKQSAHRRSPESIDAKAWLAELDAYSASGGHSLERFFARLLRDAGTQVVSESPTSDLGADLALWSDELHPIVGNPLLIEIKHRIRSPADLRKATTAFSSTLARAGTHWGILIYVEGPESGLADAAKPFPNIIVFRADRLISALSTTTFSELIRNIRNQRVHGANS